MQCVAQKKGLGEYEMAKRAKRRKAWTLTDVQKLKKMARRKTSASSIGKKLKRTEGATRQKAFSIGLSLDTRHHVGVAPPPKGARSG
jgi:hypothetical protein